MEDGEKTREQVGHLRHVRSFPRSPWEWPESRRAGTPRRGPVVEQVSQPARNGFPALPGVHRTRPEKRRIMLLSIVLVRIRQPVERTFQELHPTGAAVTLEAHQMSCINWQDALIEPTRFDQAPTREILRMIFFAAGQSNSPAQRDDTRVPHNLLIVRQHHKPSA